jgi:hypothetical protein
MPFDFESIKRKLLEDYIRTSPIVNMLYKADESGVGNLMNPRNSPPKFRGPDDLQLKRNQMSEAEYRKYLADQLRQGQEMQQPLEVKPPK